MQIAIFHNILWSKYKGGVFTAINRIAPDQGCRASFIQIAETEGDRVELGAVDMNYHQYPFELLFKGAYHDMSLLARTKALVAQTWSTEADLVILPGYDRPEYWAMLVTLVLRRKSRAVFCDSTAYDRPQKIIKGLAKRLFFFLCDGFFGYGQRSKEYLMTYGVPARRIFFRCQAAALPITYTEANAVAARIALAPRDQTRPQFLYVGRLSREKGLTTLLRAMHALRKVLPATQLKIVGAGPQKDELIRLTNELGLQDAVAFPGSMDIEQLAAEYSSATALVLPSTSEPWGLVVNESLSMGCPAVVSHRCGCVPELVIEGVTGYQFIAGDYKDLAAKMHSIAKDAIQVELVADRTICHMRSFTPEDAALQILQGCRRIVGSARKA